MYQSFIFLILYYLCACYKSVMPASLAYDMETKNGLEDQRALQLALELTMLGLSGPDGGGSNSSSDSDGVGSSFSDDTRKKTQNMTECVPVPSSEHVAEIVGRQGKIKMSTCAIFFRKKFTILSRAE